MGWLPDGFMHPEHVDLGTGHHLRPIRADDVDIDYPAVMGSRERLWAKYGEAWGWPLVSRMVGSDLGRALGDFVPRWLEETWGFRAVEYSP